MVTNDLPYVKLNLLLIKLSHKGQGDEKIKITKHCYAKLKDGLHPGEKSCGEMGCSNPEMCTVNALGGS